MNKENPILQRDQIKRPSFYKLVNNNSNTLSSPFPFMEFGLSSQSCLNNVLTNFTRENGNSTKFLSSKNDMTDQKNPTTSDPYLKPLSLDRLKSAISLNRENSSLQYGHNFIRFSSNNMRNNDFTDNFFLRTQSTRASNAENVQKKPPKELLKNNELSKLDTDSNGLTKIIREKRPVTSILTPKNVVAVNGMPRDTLPDPSLHNYSAINQLDSPIVNRSSQMRPTTAGPIMRLSRNISADPMLAIVLPANMRLADRSSKADSLIYNPATKTAARPSADKRLDQNTQQPPIFKSQNSQNLYLQVKQEVEEYRHQQQQQAKDTIIPLENNMYPPMKTISSDELFPSSESTKSRANNAHLSPPAKVSETNDAAPLVNGQHNPQLQDRIANNNQKESVLQRKNVKDDNSNKSYSRPKSVTFNEHVETRDFFGDSSSESQDDDSNDISSTDNESHGSIVSNDSDSEDIDQKYQTNKRSPHQSPSATESLMQCTTTSTTVEHLEGVEIGSSDKETEFSSINDQDENHLDIEMDSSCKSCGDESDDSDDTESLTTNNSSSKADSVCDIDKLNEKSVRKPNGEVNSRPSSSTSSSQATSSRTSYNGVVSKTQSYSDKNLKKQTQESKSKGSGTLFKQDLLEMDVYKETQNHLPLIFSKFSHVPPVLNFVGDGEKIEQLPWQLRKLLKWRTSLLTPLIVKQTISRSGFRPSRCTCSGDDLDSTESSDWILYFGKHMKGPVFKTIKEYQKVNHFPGSFQLGRKDRLWRNIYRMQQELGTNEFDFIPQTFCLPTDLELFKQCWESGGNKHKWIIKPPASARGIGVKVVYRWNQIPKRRPVVVQRYISNPYLINDSKFDLRLYVFITDINPLRIYLYDDGLVRFASTKYTNSVKSLHNRFVHLTNYSINKQNIEYLDNNDNEACKGHKWSLKSLWKYLKKRGVNIDSVWHKIKDLVIKTIISAEESINATVAAYCKSNYSVQELFGFDVILDENLKPWILEVNVSPSLHSDSPLDIIIKGGMIKDMFNLSGFVLPEPTDVDTPVNGRPRSPINVLIPSTDIYLDRRFWIYEPSPDEIAKMKHFISLATNGTEFRFDPCDNLPYQILDCLTPRDVRCLIQCLDEYERRGHFERIFPLCSINSSKKYLSYFERIHYFNLLVAAFLTKYRSNNQGMRLLENLCQKKLHLLSAQNGDKIDSRHVWKE